MARVNSTIFVVSGWNIGIRLYQPFYLGLISMPHIGLIFRVNSNKRDEGCLGINVLHILEDITTLENVKAIHTDAIHNIISDKLCVCV